MANAYIEPRPKGRREGDPIDDYVVEDHADHVLATPETQQEAIECGRRFVRAAGSDDAIPRSMTLTTL